MDILDKLRDRANAPNLAVSELNHDAADEIERLRAWVSVKTQEEARAHDYSVRMHVENARLREALTEIIRQHERFVPDDELGDLHYQGGLEVCSDIARAALAEKEEK